MARKRANNTTEPLAPPGTRPDQASAADAMAKVDATPKEQQASDGRAGTSFPVVGIGALAGGLEAYTQSLQASNEEVQSANEELLCINEELDSASEELTTVNEEMANRNAELNRLNSDLVNLEASTDLPIVVLGRDLTICRFNPQAEKQFQLLAADLGRSISGLRHNLDVRDLGAMVAEVIDTVREQSRNVRDERGRWYSLRVRPYITVENKVEGAVLVLVDIDALKQSEQAAALARDLAESTIRTVREPLLVLDRELRVESANRSFYRAFGAAPAETVGKSIFDLGDREWNIPRLRELLEQVLPHSASIDDYEIDHDFGRLGRRIMLFNASRIVGQQRDSERTLVAIEDITERRAEEARSRLAAIVVYSEDAIISKDLNGIIRSWNRGAEHLFGYAPEEVIGQPVTLLIPEGRVDEEPRILERVRRGEVIEHYETVRRRKDGSLLDVSLTVSPLKDATGRIIGASKIARDVSDRRRVDEALRESHMRLQQHAEELSRFNQVAVGRELRMIELKQEMNDLCQRHGEPPRFPLEFEHQPEA